MSDYLTIESGASVRPPRPLPSPFALKVTHAGRTATARVEGPLDLEHGSQFLNQVQPLCGEGRCLVLDLRPTDYLDSSGVRALLLLREQMEAARGELQLVIGPGSRVERTLKLLKLHDCFSTGDSMLEARGHRPQAA